MKVTIIGGGIVGLCSAFYLNQAGHEVCVIERGDGDEGCSLGNAGMIVPSHFIPLATPGMLAKGFAWMFDAESPFFVRPRLDWQLISWGIKFYQAANEKQVNRAMPALRDISLLSRALYKDLAAIPGMDFTFEEKGLLMLCKTDETLAEEIHVAQQANELGIKADVLSIEALHQLEPQVKPQVAGAVYYPNDAHLYPNALHQQMQKYLKSKGVDFIYHTEITDFEVKNDRIVQIKSHDKTFATDTLVIASGTWSSMLARLLNISLPMQGGKGYSITYPQVEDKKLITPSILLESRVAITPMGTNNIRFGGTMEIAGLNTNINRNRVRGIIKAVPNYFPDYPIEMPKQEEVWAGLRPCSPDGLPYIGPTKYKNLFLATGHAMMGLSLAPATGKLIQELVDGKKLSVSIDLYHPERY